MEKHEAPAPIVRTNLTQDWFQYLSPKWRLLVTLPFVAGALGIGLSYLVPPTFVATTTFIPPQQQNSASSALASLGALASLAGGGAVKSSAEQYVALLQSNRVSEKLIQQFDLMHVYGTKLRQDARQQLLEHSLISVGKKDGFVSITVEDTDPERSASIANQYVSELRLLNAELAISEAKQRRVFFEKQLQDVKQKLISAQQSLQGSGFNQGALNSEPKSAAEAFTKLQAELISAEIQLSTLRASLSDGAPQVSRQVALVQALRQKVGEVEQSGPTGPSGHSQDDYVSRYREFKYEETLFDLFSRQYEMARVDESREGSLIQVIDIATPAEHKIRPKRLLFGIYTALAAELLVIMLLIQLGRGRAPR